MKTFFAAAIALSMLAVPAMAAPNDQQHGNQPAMGQNHDDRGSQGQSGQSQSGQSQNGQNQGHQEHAQQNQSRPQYSYNGKKYDAVHGPAWNAPKGYDAHKSWSRGEKLPKAYRDRSYVVDYRAYHLKKPPHGYVWVRADRNVYLVSQSSGLISQIVLNLFY